jgi:adenylate kinase family enzyme
MRKKIVVIGSPGGGKSYFSIKLSKTIEVPVYHMDNIYWHEDKTHITREELVDTINTIMNKQEWIIDGNYISTIEQRIKCAETIIYLDFTTKQCIEGVKSRIGTKREDMPWVEETLDEEFLDFVIKFRAEIKPRIEKFLEIYKDKTVIRFTTREEVNIFLGSLRKGNR